MILLEGSRFLEFSLLRICIWSCVRSLHVAGLLLCGNRLHHVRLQLHLTHLDPVPLRSLVVGDLLLILGHLLLLLGHLLLILRLDGVEWHLLGKSFSFGYPRFHNTEPVCIGGDAQSKTKERS